MIRMAGEKPYPISHHVVLKLHNILLQKQQQQQTNTTPPPQTAKTEVNTKILLRALNLPFLLWMAEMHNEVERKHCLIKH